MVASPSYRALRMLLYVIAAIEGIAGIVLIFATGWVLSMSPALLTLAESGFVVMLVKGIGIVALAFGYLLCVTAREPVRYVRIIDTLIFLVMGAAILTLYGVFVLHLGVFYPAGYLVGRALIQLAIAAALVALRPRSATEALLAP